MRKPTSFFVSTLSLLLFLSLTFAACGGSTVDSSVAPSPSLAILSTRCMLWRGRPMV